MSILLLLPFDLVASPIVGANQHFCLHRRFGQHLHVRHSLKFVTRIVPSNSTLRASFSNRWPSNHTYTRPGLILASNRFISVTQLVMFFLETRCMAHPFQSSMANSS